MKYGQWKMDEVCQFCKYKSSINYTNDLIMYYSYLIHVNNEVVIYDYGYW
jgi:hypothetical protein